MKNKLIENKDKILAFFLSLIVAFGMWVYVITVVNPEYEKTYYNIPVVLQNKDILTERGLMVSGEVSAVTLVLRGDRATLNSLNESNINVFANVANIDKPGTHQLTYSISYPGNVPPNTVSTQSGSTDLITLKVEKQLKKQIPVVINYDGTAVPNGFIADLGSVYMDHSVLDIAGPESVISQIQRAEIKVNLTNMTNTLIAEYHYSFLDSQGRFIDGEGVAASAEKINLMLKILRVKEISLEVEIIDGGGATVQNTTIIRDPLKILVSGTEAQLEGLSSITVGRIDLGELTEDTVLTFEIKPKLPDGVNNETGVNEVTVEIKLPELTTKTFTVEEVIPVNATPGLAVDVITQALTVTVRGPAKQISKLTEEDLQVYVDLTNVQAGMTRVNAEISISDQFTGVGVIGTYPITVELKSA